MADELTLNVSAVYDDGILPEVRAQITNRVKTVTTTRPALIVQSVGTSEEAVELGDVGTPCLLYLQNLDQTNYIDVKCGTGGTIFARLRPDTNGDGKGGFCFLDETGSGATAPFVIANTAPCRMAVMTAPA